MSGRIPLSAVEAGARAVVKEINGGRNLHQRLLAMGLGTDTSIKVIRNDGAGPLIISLGAGRLGVGRGVALKIMVERE